MHYRFMSRYGDMLWRFFRLLYQEQPDMRPRLRRERLHARLRPHVHREWQ